MKKTIIIEVLLLFVTAVLAYFCVTYWTGVNTYIKHNLINEQHLESFRQILTFAIFITIGLLSALAAIILIAIKDFPIFQPLVEKAKAKSNARKQSKEQTKAARTEANKQARIEQLQAELDELKKD